MCGAPIVIQLEPTNRYPVPTDALAYALPYKDGLAHVMVHEIGHVLEQMQRHSENGVMKARWSAADIKRMERDPLPFAPEDVESIREGLLRRATHAAAE
jgi:hypothetical protein